MITTVAGRSALAPAGRVAAAAVAAQLALWALGAPAAWAAEGGSGSPWLDLLWKAVNLAALVAVIVWFGGRPLANLFRGAAEETRVALADRRERAAAAETEAAEQRRRIENLEADLERMLNETRAEAQAEHERLVAEARTHAERIRNAVSVQVAQEFSKARKALQSELAQQTVQLAEQMIRERMDEQSRERTATRAIEQLGARS